MNSRLPVGLRMSPRRALVGIVASVVVGAGIGLGVTSLGRSASPRSSSTAPRHLAPPAGAIVFDEAASDNLDARIEIAFVPAGGGTVVPLTAKRGMVAAEPRWSPDGSRIAFVRSPRGHLTRYAGDGDISVMNADGTHIRRLTDELDASSPAWSPDGSRIAFIEGQGQGLAVMRSDGSDQHVIAHRRGYYESPAWSPDGRLIAYDSGPDWSTHAIFTIRPNGTGEHQLTPRSGSTGSPAWSPEGSRIAYSARDQLWIMNSDGSGARRLTNCQLRSCVSDLAPAWSPDGKDLVFVRQEDGGAARRLYILNLATDAMRPLTPNVQWAGRPDWRPRAG